MSEEAAETPIEDVDPETLPVDGEKLAAMLEKTEGLAKVFGEDWLASKLQRFFALLTVRVFSNHGPADLKGAILRDYPLVEEVMPPAVKNALPRVAPRFEETIRAELSPDQVMEWLEDPDWSDELDDDEQERLQACATVIRETPGGTEWLVSQVDFIHEQCGFSPEDSTPSGSDV